MLDTANCSLNCTVTAYDMIDCTESECLCVCVCTDEEETPKSRRKKIAISVEQETLSEHRKINTHSHATMYTWLNFHLSTTRFKCSFPTFIRTIWSMISSFNSRWLCCLAGPDWLNQCSIFRLVRNETTEPSSLAIPFGVYPSSSRVYITQVCVRVCEGKWLCVNMRVFWLLLTHLIHHVFACNLWAYRCRCYTSSSCVPHCLCIRASLAGKINHMSKKLCVCMYIVQTDGWMDGWIV